MQFLRPETVTVTQYDFIHVICQLGRCGIQIKFNLWLPVFLENVRRIWRFKETSLV
jgi:hypothetical protein